MPSKDSFWCEKYSQAAGYENHLRTALANQNNILASMVRYTPSAIIYNNDRETDLLYYKEHERPDSAYKTDLDSTGGDHDLFINDITNDSNSEIPNGTPGSLAGKQTPYEGPEKPVGNDMDLSMNAIF